MKKLFSRALFLLLPFLVLITYFLIDDPMKIIGSNDSPVSSGVLMNDRLFQARYLEKKPEAYNSFIFGSSRSRAFKTDFWTQHLKKNAKAFHMGVNDETLYGLYKKLHYLDSLGYKPDNALLVLDHRLLSLTKDHEAHIFREYYTLTGETASSYYRRYFKAFLTVDFLKHYFNYKRTGVIDESANSFLWDPGFTYNKKTGDIFYTRMDEWITKDSLDFYIANAAEFHPRTASTSDTLIRTDAKKLLKEIKALVKKNDTKVKVIITPNYDLVKLNPHDVRYLRRLFGKKNVHDFSGENDITNEVGNYYEYKHFKPYIANDLMGITYKNGK